MTPPDDRPYLPQTTAADNAQYLEPEPDWDQLLQWENPGGPLFLDGNADTNGVLDPAIFDPNLNNSSPANGPVENEMLVQHPPLQKHVSVGSGTGSSNAYHHIPAAPNAPKGAVAAQGASRRASNGSAASPGPSRRFSREAPRPTRPLSRVSTERLASLSPSRLLPHGPLQPLDPPRRRSNEASAPPSPSQCFLPDVLEVHEPFRRNSNGAQPSLSPSRVLDDDPLAAPASSRHRSNDASAAPLPPRSISLPRSPRNESNYVSRSATYESPSGRTRRPKAQERGQLDPALERASYHYPDPQQALRDRSPYAPQYMHPGPIRQPVAHAQFPPNASCNSQRHPRGPDPYHVNDAYAPQEYQPGNSRPEMEHPDQSSPYGVYHDRYPPHAQAFYSNYSQPQPQPIPGHVQSTSVAAPYPTARSHPAWQASYLLPPVALGTYPHPPMHHTGFDNPNVMPQNQQPGHQADATQTGSGKPRWTHGKVAHDRKMREEGHWRCNAYRFYTRLFNAPQNWGRIGHQPGPIFRYQADGKWEADLRFTTEELRYYFQKTPWTRLWLQHFPAQSNHRMSSNTDMICRWVECPTKSQKIQSGWFRIAFDEDPVHTSNGDKDPYFVAGSMHLWCFEQCFDPAEFLRSGRMVPDNRQLPKEEKKRFAITRDSDKCIIEKRIMPWLQSKLEMPSQSIPRDHEQSLSYGLVTYHMGQQTKHRQDTRTERNKGQAEGVRKTMDYHTGDLSVYVGRQQKFVDVKKKKRLGTEGNKRANDDDAVEEKPAVAELPASTSAMPASAMSAPVLQVPAMPTSLPDATVGQPRTLADTIDPSVFTFDTVSSVDTLDNSNANIQGGVSLVGNDVAQGAMPLERPANPNLGQHFVLAYEPILPEIVVATSYGESAADSSSPRNLRPRPEKRRYHEDADTEQDEYDLFGEQVSVKRARESE